MGLFWKNPTQNLMPAVGNPLLNYAIYDNAATMENEANMFVAEYLLDTDETMQVLTEQNSFFVTASILEVPPEILDFKWRMRPISTNERPT